MDFVPKTLPTPLHLGRVEEAVRQVLGNIPGTSTLPVDNPTIPFWSSQPEDNPLSREGADGPLPDQVDICIIGSGITGVGFAYHIFELLKNSKDCTVPLKVVILEARDFCNGATGRNGGHLTPFFGGFHSRSHRHGVDEALRAARLEVYTVSTIIDIINRHDAVSEVDLVEGGHNILLFTQEEADSLRLDFEAAKQAGLDLSHCEWLEAEETQKRYGSSYPAIRIPGWNLWPLKLVTLLYRLASSDLSSSSSSPNNKPSLDLSLHTHTPVHSIIPIISPSTTHPHKWNVNTSRGSIRTSYVIHATNAYVSHLIPHLSGPSGVIPTRGQVVCVQATAPSTKVTTSAWSGNEGFEYWFPRPVTSALGDKPVVILGGGREATGPGFELYETDDSKVNSAVSKVLEEFLPAIFPGVYASPGESLSKMEWSGIMGFTSSGDPMVGPVPAHHDDPEDKGTKGVFLPGQYMAVGYSGHGMPRAFSCAEVVAQMVFIDLAGKEQTDWKLPDWMPKNLLTRNITGTGTSVA